MNARVKRWPGWILLVFVAVGLFTFGATRDTGPRTVDDRIESISKRLACPVCQGESVYESRNPASNQIRVAVRQAVDDGALTDDQIVDQIQVAYEGEELLIPRATGIEALAWALPSTAFVVGLAGLTIAFRRWQAESRRLGSATQDDYALVASALDDQSSGPPGEHR
ncbi:MAG: cytochrome c-type biogenesis protein CcmH [Ilumatobacteraceae bacterium]